MTPISNKKSRSKPAEPAILKINDWAEADEMVRQIGDLTTQIVNLQCRAKITMDHLKAGLADEVDPRNAAINIYARSLEAFCANHTDAFGEARSKKLNFGTVGWRKSSAIAIKSIKATLEKLRDVFGRDARNFIRIKEEPDKEAIGKLRDEQFAAIGVRREEREVFFVEPAIPIAADHGS